MLFDFYGNFENIWGQLNSEFKNANTKIKDFRGNFLKLFDPEQFRNFINEAKQIGDNIKILVMQASGNMSELREFTQEAFSFTVASPAILKEIIERFNTT